MPLTELVERRVSTNINRGGTAVTGGLSRNSEGSVTSHGRNKNISESDGCPFTLNWLCFEYFQRKSFQTSPETKLMFQQNCGRPEDMSRLQKVLAVLIWMLPVKGSDRKTHLVQERTQTRQPQNCCIFLSYSHPFRFPRHDAVEHQTLDVFLHCRDSYSGEKKRKLDAKVG